MSEIVAYRGKFEVHFTLSLEQIEHIDQTIAQIEVAGYTATRPYEKKVEGDVDGTFLRYEERTDGKKGFYAVVKTPTTEEKVVQFQKFLVANLPVTIYQDEKGYKQIKVREIETPF